MSISSSIPSRQSRLKHDLMEILKIELVWIFFIWKWVTVHMSSPKATTGAPDIHNLIAANNTHESNFSRTLLLLFVDMPGLPVHKLVACTRALFCRYTHLIDSTSHIRQLAFVEALRVFQLIFRQEVEEIANLCKKYNVLMISDDVYEHMVGSQAELLKLFCLQMIISYFIQLLTLLATLKGSLQRLHEFCCTLKLRNCLLSWHSSWLLRNRRHWLFSETCLLPN